MKVWKPDDGQLPSGRDRGYRWLVLATVGLGVLMLVMRFIGTA